MTLAGAAREARKAGYRNAVSFNDWLRAKRLEDRSSGVVERLRQAYGAGLDKRETDDRLKDDAQEARRDRQREKARAASERKQAKAESQKDVAKLSSLDEKALERHYAKGGTLSEFLKSNPARKSKEYRAAWKRLRKNPASGTAAAFEEFQGRKSSELVEVTERAHYHKHLASAGELKQLVVMAIDGKGDVKLSGFGGALLAFNERKNQLFITGGDQSVDLSEFGIDPRKAHELETLGKVKSLDYFTRKDHLGDEGGEAIFRHKLRTTNENGRHVTVRVARYPDLIYRVRDKKLEFSGGSYEIRAEGIDL